MSKQIICRDIKIGGGAPVSIQSMTNVDTRDEKALLYQINELKNAGCEIVRIAIPDFDSAETFKNIRKKVDMPLVADIHFDYRLALKSIEYGADKIRINPGNIGDNERVKQVIDAAKERNIPIRVGVNSGSLEKSIVNKYGGVTKEGIVESALDTLKIIEDMDYDNLVLSIKSSDVVMNYQSHLLIRDKIDYPLHIGVTEAGTIKHGIIKSAIGIGGLLLAGIGDTLRVSLTTDPVQEVLLGKEILETVGMRTKNIELVSCPTCGRTRVNLEKLATEIEEKLEPIGSKRKEAGKPPIKVAVMGCVVNGPGEAKEADYGVAGGLGKGVIFSKGEVIKTVEEKDIVTELINIIEKG
ncbi:MAG: flavodoxin-dependent (E)-4-hydroxy-3-methylbut-2-enyl-diphosphate synthase [Peptostreptococcaceae bacterium]|nr:flavodoxin-dependent (E)-4-hydroxy-3-methylbut-2-enyl-diphosphate synthase [Peptostreptococcaceae bacterium]